jgi:ribosomal protein RSM22 (predicted rRNA methylase)
MSSLPLFTQPDDFALKGLTLLYRILDTVMPMNGAQKRDLPLACRDLSAQLTTERDALRRPYWTAPRLTSAYLRYFLPWNLVRLSSLLPGLNLGQIPKEPLILDMGSGPLTLPLALWLSRPDLRSLPVTVVASDTTPHILELGRKIFESLRAEMDPESPWIIRTMRASVMQALHRLHAKPGTLWMLTSGNVLNEMEERRARPGHQMADRMRELLENAAAMLAENGLVFAIEPGNRQGGRLIANLRKSALGGIEEEPEYEDLTSFALREEQAGRRKKSFPGSSAYSSCEEDEDDSIEFGLPPLFRPLSPCTHNAGCPMLDRRTTAWCHVNAPADYAPQSLRTLSSRAGLDKDSVSLSFLLLKKLKKGEDLLLSHDTPSAKRTVRPAGKKPLKPQTLTARIVSDAFIVPDYPGRARYACTEQGLALIPCSAHLSPGALCKAWKTPERDWKSRAAILMLDEDRHTSPRSKRENRSADSKQRPVMQKSQKH